MGGAGGSGAVASRAAHGRPRGRAAPGRRDGTGRRGRVPTGTHNQRQPRDRPVGAGRLRLPGIRSHRQGAPSLINIVLRCAGTSIFPASPRCRCVSRAHYACSPRWRTRLRSVKGSKRRSLVRQRGPRDDSARHSDSHNNCTPSGGPAPLNPPIWVLILVPLFGVIGAASVPVLQAALSEDPPKLTRPCVEIAAGYANGLRISRKCES